MTDYKNLKANDWWYQDVYPVDTKLNQFEFDWEGKRVLDLGCNVGEVGEYVLSRGAKRYTGVDVNDDYIEEAKKRHPDLEIEKADAREYLEENWRKYDTVIALGLFHHLSDEDVKSITRFKKNYIYEVPTHDTKKYPDYNVRPKTWYENLRPITETFESGMPLDPSYPFERLIFVSEIQA